MAKFEDLAREVKEGWSAEAHAVHARASQVFADEVKDHGTNTVEKDEK